MSGSTPRLRTAALLTDALDEAEGPNLVVRSRFHVPRGDLEQEIHGALFGCWLWKLGVDPAAELRMVVDRLVPGARVRFCEPSPGPSVIPGLGAVLTGYRFERDIPALIRASGLIVTTIERFAIAPGAWFCAGVAEFDPLELGDPDLRTR